MFPFTASHGILDSSIVSRISLSGKRQMKKNQRNTKCGKRFFSIKSVGCIQQSEIYFCRKEVYDTQSKKLYMEFQEMKDKLRPRSLMSNYAEDDGIKESIQNMADDIRHLKMDMQDNSGLKLQDHDIIKYKW